MPRTVGAASHRARAGPAPLPPGRAPLLCLWSGLLRPGGARRPEVDGCVRLLKSLLGHTARLTRHVSAFHDEACVDRSIAWRRAVAVLLVHCRALCTFVLSLQQVPPGRPRAEPVGYAPEYIRVGRRAPGRHRVRVYSAMVLDPATDAGSNPVGLIPPTNRGWRRFGSSDEPHPARDHTTHPDSAALELSKATTDHSRLNRNS